MDSFFLRHFLRDPKNVGALFPLTKPVALEMIKILKLNGLQNKGARPPWRILEVGAGTGNISHEIQAHLLPQDRLDLIEIDQYCCELLKQKFQNDPRIQVHCLSILDWKPPYRYDLMISTLPLNSFSPQKVENILAHCQALGKENAFYSYVEYIGLEKIAKFFASRATRQAILQRRRILEQFQRQFLTEKVAVYPNILPCYVYHMQLHADKLSKGHAKGLQNDY
jgi:phosphatidylethanolamine/phosphatidyl-N-methylethanolamine N-methyltransferase